MRFFLRHKGLVSLSVLMLITGGVYSWRNKEGSIGEYDQRDKHEWLHTQFVKRFIDAVETKDVAALENLVGRHTFFEDNEQEVEFVELTLKRLRNSSEFLIEKSFEAVVGKTESRGQKDALFTVVGFYQMIQSAGYEGVSEVSNPLILSSRLMTTGQISRKVSYPSLIVK